MIDQYRRSVEFDGEIDESGKIAIPANLAKEMKGSFGTIHVRLTSKAINSKLKEHDVSEEEIERICLVQLESREQVGRFLLSEGVLRKTPIRKRMTTGWREAR